MNTLRAKLLDITASIVSLRASAKSFIYAIVASDPGASYGGIASIIVYAPSSSGSPSNASLSKGRRFSALLNTARFVSFILT